MANENERPAPIKIGGELEPQTVDYILGTAETIIDDTWDKSESQNSKRQSAINSYLQDEIEDIQAESWGELTPDTIPEYNSGHLITSGGVYTGITAAKTFLTGETVPTIGIDANPTNNSTNLVKSGGVQNELALGAVYDVSAKNPTAGPNNDGKWESLSALLSDANLNTLIPTSVRKGGMSIKFVQTSDNKYVSYMLIKNSFTTDIHYWEKTDLENEVTKLNNEINECHFQNTYESGSYPTTATSVGFGANNGQKLIVSAQTTGSLGYGWFITGIKSNGTSETLYSKYSAITEYEINIESDYKDIQLRIAAQNTGTISIEIKLENYRANIKEQFNAINTNLNNRVYNYSDNFPLINSKTGFCYCKSEKNGSLDFTTVTKKVLVSGDHMFIRLNNVEYRVEWGFSVSYDGLSDGAYAILFVPNISSRLNSTISVKSLSSIEVDDIVIAGFQIKNGIALRWLFSQYPTRIDDKYEYEVLDSEITNKTSFALGDYSDMSRRSKFVISNISQTIEVNYGHVFFVYAGNVYRVDWGSSISYASLANNNYLLALIPNISSPNSSTMVLRSPSQLNASDCIVAGMEIVNGRVVRVLFSNYDIEDNSISSYNIDKDDIAIGAKQCTETYGHDGTNQFPMFLVVTDIHGNSADRNFTALNRAFDYAKEKSFVDSVLCLGDIGDSSNYLINYDWEGKVLACGKPVLTVPGNHEFVYHTGQSEYLGFTDEQMFAKLCTSDLLANNGETHGGTNHDKNYWYKDISKTGYDGVARKIRIIGLYQYELSEPDTDGNLVSRYKSDGLYKQEQIEWFVNLLSTVEENMYVIVLTHATVIGTTPIIVDNAFSPKLYGWGTNPYNMAEDNRDFIAQIVNAWVTGVNGTFTDSFTYGDSITVTTNFSSAHPNKFICFLCGHSHKDIIAKHREFDLYQVMLNCTAVDQIQQSSDSPRQYVGKTRDSITLFTYDWFAHQVRLIRLGSDVTMDMRERKYASLNV